MLYMMKEKENVEMKVAEGTKVWNGVYGEGTVVLMHNEQFIVIKFPRFEDYVVLARYQLHIV
jgi:hypothetical protein